MVASKWTLDGLNFALGCADGLVSPELRRNRPTEERLREHFQQCLSDSHRSRPVQPPRRATDVETRLERA